MKIDGIKMKCIDCSTYVSNKIERLRNHRKRFHSANNQQEAEPEPEIECNLNQIPQHEPKPTKRPKICQTQMSSFSIETDTATSNQLDLQIARFFYACNMPFNVAEHKEFKAMISLLRPGYSSPKRKDLSGRLLDCVHDHIHEHIVRELHDKDVTLVQDGWSDIHNNPVIATSIHTGSKSYLLNAVDTGSNKKTASYCTNLFEKSRSQLKKKNLIAIQLELLQITKRKWNQCGKNTRIRQHAYWMFFTSPKSFRAKCDSSSYH